MSALPNEGGLKVKSGTKGERDYKGGSLTLVSKDLEIIKELVSI